MQHYKLDSEDSGQEDGMKKEKPSLRKLLGRAALGISLLLGSNGCSPSPENPVQHKSQLSTPGASPEEIRLKKLAEYEEKLAIPFNADHTTEQREKVVEDRLDEINSAFKVLPDNDIPVPPYHEPDAARAKKIRDEYRKRYGPAPWEKSQ